jgi:hypothetical protein
MNYYFLSKMVAEHREEVMLDGGDIVAIVIAVLCLCFVLWGNWRDM